MDIDEGRPVRLAATLLLLLVLVIMAAGSALTVHLGKRALRRRWQRRQWDELVAHHRELDRALDKIWPPG